MLPLTGIVKVAPFLDMSEEDWDSVIDVNLKGVFLVRPVAVLMLDAKTGFPCSWLPIDPFSSPGCLFVVALWSLISRCQPSYMAVTTSTCMM